MQKARGGEIIETESATTLSRDSVARILDVAQKLAQPLDLMHLLAAAVDASKSVLTADRGALWLYEKSTEELVMRIPELAPAPRIAIGEGLVGQCMHSREIINVSDARSDPRFLDKVDRMTGYSTETMLNLPLLGWDRQPVGVLQLLNKSMGGFDRHDEQVAMALAAQCAVAVQRAQLTEALLLNERLDEEVSLAREIQMATLPTEMPKVGGYDLHGEFIPTGRAGGDLFDLVVLNDELFILLGDATGHGFGPALSATQLQAMLRVAFRCGADLDQAYRHVNNQLEEDLPDDRFVTAFMGLLNPRDHRLRYHSGGQGPILFYRANPGRCEWFRPTTFPVGVMPIDDPGPAQELEMRPGDVLVLLSDGIYEFENRQGARFGEERIGQLLDYHHHLPAAEIARQILNATYEFGGDVVQADDITLVIVRRLEEEST